MRKVNLISKSNQFVRSLKTPLYVPGGISKRALGIKQGPWPAICGYKSMENDTINPRPYLHYTHAADPQIYASIVFETYWDPPEQNNQIHPTSLK